MLPLMNSAAGAFDFDLAVLGGGSAGYAAARTAVAAGLKTVVIEGGDEVGGLCILRGCMPTKALLYAAEVLHLSRHAETWGLRVREAGFDFARVMARKARLIADFAAYRRGQLTDGRFAFVRARARFADPHALALSTGATLRARAFVLATGSIVSPPPLPSLRELGYLTSDDAVSLAHLPRSLIVLGGGPTALEFAQFFARFDVKVTLIQRSAQVLRDVDADAAEAVTQALRREGIRVFTGTELLEARREAGLKAVTFRHAGQTERIAAEEVLYALGRVPAVAGLGLDRAGVAVEAGRITTDAQMRTTAPHIYAAGDCTGQHEIVHVAIQQGEIAAHNAARPEAPRAFDDRLLTTVVFTEPQVATVGLTEKRAQALGVPYRVAQYPFNDHGKSLIQEALDGFVKLLADPRTGVLLGGAVVGPSGGELIHEIVVALAARLTAREFAAVPHYHPTLAEIWTYPAEELAEACGP